MQLDELNLNAQSTTIDASVIQSRILQSASIQKEQGMAMDDAHDGDQPHFPELSAVQASGGKVEYRRVRCPPHRYTPLREHWEQILTPLVEYLKLQVSCSDKNTPTRHSLRIEQRTKMLPAILQCIRVVPGTTQIIQEASFAQEEMGR